eukprot:6815301-Pyramimonas_sp.AAC.1
MPADPSDRQALHNVKGDAFSTLFQLAGYSLAGRRLQHALPIGGVQPGRHAGRFDGLCRVCERDMTVRSPSLSRHDRAVAVSLLT